MVSRSKLGWNTQLQKMDLAKLFGSACNYQVWTTAETFDVHQGTWIKHSASILLKVTDRTVIVFDQTKSSKKEIMWFPNWYTVTSNKEKQ